MKTKFLIMTLCITTISIPLSAQFNPLEIIDKVGSTLLPKVVEGVKEIQEAKRKDKNEEAEKMKTEYEEKLKEVTKSTKASTIKAIGKDIEYLNTINLIQGKIERISNDVGRLSIFKDQQFLDVLLSKQSVSVKNEIVRKFQNALQQVNENKATLNALRDNISTESVPASGQAAAYINSIISKLQEINSSYDDAPTLTEANADEKKVDSCLRTIKSIGGDITILENEVESLNAAASQMLTSFLSQYKKIKDSQ